MTVGDSKAKQGIAMASDGAITQLKQALDSAGFGRNGVGKIAQQPKLARYMAAAVDELDPKYVLHEGVFDEWYVASRSAFTRSSEFGRDVIYRQRVELYKSPVPREGRLERWWLSEEGNLLVEVSRREGHAKHRYSDFYLDGKFFATLDAEICGWHKPYFSAGALYYEERSKDNRRITIFRKAGDRPAEEVLTAPAGQYHDWVVTAGRIFGVRFKENGMAFSEGDEEIQVPKVSEEDYCVSDGHLFILAKPRETDTARLGHVSFVPPNGYCPGFAPGSCLRRWTCWWDAIQTLPTFEWQDKKTGERTIVHSLSKSQDSQLIWRLPYVDWRAWGDGLYVRFFKPDGRSVILVCGET